MKKRWCAIFLASLMLCSFLPAAAQTPLDVVVRLQIENPLMEVNGVKKEIDAGRGTSPVICAGRTMVPIRAIIEAFGGKADWNDAAKTAILTLKNDEIRLTLGDTAAYRNQALMTLDVAPKVINERIMMPIRFVAEGFRLGVAWDEKTRTVSILRNAFDAEEYRRLESLRPAFDGEPYAVINENKPFFQEYERIGGFFEYYSELDSLGRCNVCMAAVGREGMPTAERESISHIFPSGWKNETYDTIEGRYLYNRCHLIGFQLTGENANERNLITGTRYLNVEGMLPFENQIDAYVEATGNHVLYRVTPVFSGNNLLADGVLLEAFSLEDDGAGLSFCVYCYNVQPGVAIDYASGENMRAADVQNDAADEWVYKTPTGKRYHRDAECGGDKSYMVPLPEAAEEGLTPCLKCAA